MFLRAAICLLILMFSSAAFAGDASHRVALVIGNAAYAYAGRLANPSNDAADVAAALTRLGFKVTPVFDTAGADLASAVDDFLGRARGADVAVFYYAGHGLQYDGSPYLLPIDAKLENEFAIKREALAAQDIVTALENTAHASIVVLDACRNNPLAEQLRQRLASRGRAAAVSRGLGRIEAASGNTLVVYSAGPGQEAQDGGGRNSPFTTAFLKHAETPGLEVEQMLKRVTAEVEAATGGKQQPERLSRLKIELWLKEGAAPGDDEVAKLKARLAALDEQLKAAQAKPSEDVAALKEELTRLRAELKQQSAAQPLEDAPTPEKPNDTQFEEIGPPVRTPGGRREGSPPLFRF